MLVVTEVLAVEFRPQGLAQLFGRGKTALSQVALATWRSGILRINLVITPLFLNQLNSTNSSSEVSCKYAGPTR